MAYGNCFILNSPVRCRYYYFKVEKLSQDVFLKLASHTYGKSVSRAELRPVYLLSLPLTPSDAAAVIESGWRAECPFPLSQDTKAQNLWEFHLLGSHHPENGCE